MRQPRIAAGPSSSFRVLCFVLVLLGAGRAQKPTEGETILPAKGGWVARLAWTSDAGIWYAKVAKVLPAYGAPEIIACDDKGRALVLSVYSGRWTGLEVVPDGQWLAPTLPVDVDPRVPGRELYAAGKAGNLHQLLVESRPFGRYALTSREIGHFAGEEVHTVVAADFDPKTPGGSILVFAISGAVWLFDPMGAEAGRFAGRRIADVQGRVRDAVVVERGEGHAPEVIAVSRGGQVLRLSWDGGKAEITELAHEGMGLGRIALAPRAAATDPVVIYVTRDDGVVVRFSCPADAAPTRELVFVGAEGPRGIVAGRFFDDGREAFAVYGYGKDVQLVSRAPGRAWTFETIFSGEDQGHWLAAGEIDGRNATDELVATGFLGRVVVLGRPAGYGLRGAAVDLGDAPRAPSPSAAPGTEARPLRVAARFPLRAAQELSPLAYDGGFETKTLVYETLVRRGPDGNFVPGLAEAWRAEEEGRRWIFTLREGARWHDGAPVSAREVAVHFRRWVGLPEHGWLPATERIESVTAPSERELRITLDRPHDLLPSLVAVNPAALRGPGALDGEGRHVRPVGSGPFRLAEARQGGGLLRYLRAGQAPLALDLVRLGDDEEALDALLREEVDLVVGSWLVDLAPARVAALARDPRFRVVAAPGSSVISLGFRMTDGPTADPSIRRAIAASIEREEIVRVVEHGRAVATRRLIAPACAAWPDPPPEGPGVGVFTPGRLRLAVRGSDRRERDLAPLVASQLRRSGFDVALVDGEAEADLRFERSFGLPYDPELSILDRFGTKRGAAAGPFRAADPELSALVDRLLSTLDAAARRALFGEIQARVAATLPVVPLFVPDRLAVMIAEAPEVTLDPDLYGLGTIGAAGRAPAPR